MGLRAGIVEERKATQGHGRMHGGPPDRGPSRLRFSLIDCRMIERARRAPGCHCGDRELEVGWHLWRWRNGE
jgi:hypothetical protein